MRKIKTVHFICQYRRHFISLEQCCLLQTRKSCLLGNGCRNTSFNSKVGPKMANHCLKHEEELKANTEHEYNLAVRDELYEI